MNSEETEVTEAEIKNAIKETPNKTSSSPDGISAIHLKHLGSKAIKLIANLFTIVLNKNKIPQLWKTSKIIPLLKPGKDPTEGKSYRPISLLCSIAKLLEKIVLNRIQPFIPKTKYQHGYKKKHSTTTALQKITNIIANGFNQKRPPKRTVLIAVDMSKAFDVVDHTKLIEKLMKNTQIPPLYLKFLSNYIQGRRGYTTFAEAVSSQRNFHGGVAQGGVLSPQLFNIFMADMPQPNATEGVHLVVYADVTLVISHHARTYQCHRSQSPSLSQRDSEVA